MFTDTDGNQWDTQEEADASNEQIAFANEGTFKDLAGNVWTSQAEADASNETINAGTGPENQDVTEIPNTAKEGEEGAGWKYYTDGTSISPKGVYYNSEMPGGSFDTSTLEPGVIAKIKAAYSNADGSINWGQVFKTAAPLLGGALAVSSNNSAGGQGTAAYQGGIPSLTASRTMNPIPAGKRPGAGGITHFTPMQYAGNRNMAPGPGGGTAGSTTTPGTGASTTGGGSGGIATPGASTAPAPTAQAPSSGGISSIPRTSSRTTAGTGGKMPTDHTGILINGDPNSELPIAQVLAFFKNNPINNVQDLAKLYKWGNSIGLSNLGLAQARAYAYQQLGIDTYSNMRGLGDDPNATKWDALLKNTQPGSYIVPNAAGIATPDIKAWMTQHGKDANYQQEAQQAIQQYGLTAADLKAAGVDPAGFDFTTKAPSHIAGAAGAYQPDWADNYNKGNVWSPVQNRWVDTNEIKQFLGTNPNTQQVLKAGYDLGLTGQDLNTALKGQGYTGQALGQHYNDLDFNLYGGGLGYSLDANGKIVQGGGNKEVTTPGGAAYNIRGVPGQVIDGANNWSEKSGYIGAGSIGSSGTPVAGSSSYSGGYSVNGNFTPTPMAPAQPSQADIMSWYNQHAQDADFQQAAQQAMQQNNITQQQAIAAGVPQTAFNAPTPAPTAPQGVSNADISSFYQQNANNPAAIQAAMAQYGVTADQAAAATGQNASAFQFAAPAPAPAPVRASAPTDWNRYLQLNPDVAAAGVDPAQHWAQYGQNEGRQFAKGGGISALPGAAASQRGRFLRGAGDGVSDSIPARINGQQEAALADNEFVIPARAVSEIGNGSSEAGARKLYAMLDRIEKTRHTNKNTAKDTHADRHLPV